MGERWILALDLGTGGLKTAAVSLRGELLGHATGVIHTRHLPGGGAEQDPAEWWTLVREGVREVLAAGGAAPGDVAGVGITGQWGSTVPVGADGCAAGPCLTWADHRGGPYSAAVLGGPLAVLGYTPGNLARWLRFTGGAPSPHGADPLGHELHLRHREPELYARTDCLMEPLDYLGLRLTGRRAATPASMILSWLTDNRPGFSVGLEQLPGQGRRELAVRHQDAELLFQGVGADRLFRRPHLGDPPVEPGPHAAAGAAADREPAGAAPARGRR